MPTGKLQRYFKHGMLVQLRVFEAVARLGSFTRAGEETHMAQPTVSVHMRKLAETVGVALIEQAGRRVRLTPAGEEVYAASRRILAAFGELDRRITDVSDLKAGSLRIAATSAGEHLLPQLIAHFLKLYPGIEVSLHVSSRKDIVARLAAQADDLYLLTRVPEVPAVEAHPILPNPLLAVAAADHPLAGEKKIAFERFAREALLMREPGSGTRLDAERAFAGHGLEPTVRMELGSNEAIREAIIAGLGVALLYRSALGYELDSRRLAILDVEGVPRGGSWHFIHPVGTQLPGIAQAFVEFARREAGRIFDERAAHRAQPVGDRPTPKRRRRSKARSGRAVNRLTV